MNEHRPTLVQEIAEATIAFKRKTTGHAPKAVTVVLSQDTLVITLHEALSPAEKDMGKSPAGAEKVQGSHRQLFSTSSRQLQEKIKEITGVEWPEAVTEVEPTTGAVVQAFTRSAVVQVFCLTPNKPGGSRSRRTPDEPLSDGR